MKLLQFYLPEEGIRAGALRYGKVLDLTSAEPAISSILDLFSEAGRQKKAPRQFIHELTSRRSFSSYDYQSLDISINADRPHLLAPIFAPEVWAFGVTYKKSAKERDKDGGGQKGIYESVYASSRPECFFKATPSRCVGPHDYICIRSDSVQTAPEPELAYILGENRKILGFTICNDVSAWDIERDNPLYLPQSKIYSGCCALGPVIVTPEELSDPFNLEITCRIIRNQKILYRDSVCTSRLNRGFDEMSKSLCLDNPIPFGSVVSTGTGIIIPNDHHLEGGDLVEIEIEGIGKLTNPVKQL
jgi:2-dehydro-3-deoxy-D-arabinonate dehydratase